MSLLLLLLGGTCVCLLLWVIAMTFFLFFRVLPLLPSPNPTPPAHAANGNGHIVLPPGPELKPSSHKEGRLLRTTFEVPCEIATAKGGFKTTMSTGDASWGGEPSAHDLRGWRTQAPPHATWEPSTHGGGRTREALPWEPSAHEGGRTREAHPLATWEPSAYGGGRTLHIPQGWSEKEPVTFIARVPEPPNDASLFTPPKISAPPRAVQRVAPLPEFSCLAIRGNTVTVETKHIDTAPLVVDGDPNSSYATNFFKTHLPRLTPLITCKAETKNFCFYACLLAFLGAAQSSANLKILLFSFMWAATYLLELDDVTLLRVLRGTLGPAYFQGNEIPTMSNFGATVKDFMGKACIFSGGPGLRKALTSFRDNLAPVFTSTYVENTALDRTTSWEMGMAIWLLLLKGIPNLPTLLFFNVTSANSMFSRHTQSTIAIHLGAPGPAGQPRTIIQAFTTLFDNHFRPLFKKGFLERDRIITPSGRRLESFAASILHSLLTFMGDSTRIRTLVRQIAANKGAIYVTPDKFKVPGRRGEDVDGQTITVEEEKEEEAAVRLVADTSEGTAPLPIINLSAGTGPAPLSEGGASTLPANTTGERATLPLPTAVPTTTSTAPSSAPPTGTLLSARSANTSSGLNTSYAAAAANSSSLPLPRPTGENSPPSPLSRSNTIPAAKDNATPLPPRARILVAARASLAAAQPPPPPARASSGEARSASSPPAAPSTSTNPPPSVRRFTRTQLDQPPL